MDKMSLRDHRKKSEGKRHKNRMPAPDEFKMGTRIHNTKHHDDDGDLDVVQCHQCGRYVDIAETELEHNDFWCMDCYEFAYYNAEDKD